MQCHETSLVNLPVLHIIYIMFRDSRNPGSNQKFLLLVVFLEGFHPYFRLVPVQNNFRLELSLFQVIYLIKGTSLLKQWALNGAIARAFDEGNHSKAATIFEFYASKRPWCNVTKFILAWRKSTSVLEGYKKRMTNQKTVCVISTNHDPRKYLGFHVDLNKRSKE